MWFGELVWKSSFCTNNACVIALRSYFCSTKDCFRQRSTDAARWCCLSHAGCWFIASELAGGQRRNLIKNTQYLVWHWINDTRYRFSHYNKIFCTVLQSGIGEALATNHIHCMTCDFWLNRGGEVALWVAEILCSVKCRQKRPESLF